MPETAQPEKAKKGNGLDLEEVVAQHTEALRLKDVEISDLRGQVARVAQESLLYMQTVKERESAESKEELVSNQLLALLQSLTPPAPPDSQEEKGR